LKQISYDIEDDSFYLFTSAELMTREAELLDKSKIDKMLKSQNPDELMRLLRDTVYSGYAEELANRGNFESVIAIEYKKIADFLLRNLKTSHQAAGELLFFEETVHNMKTVIKSIILDEDMERLFIPVYYSYGKLKNALETGDYAGLSQPVSGTLQHASEKMKSEKNSRILEFEIEKFYLKEIFKSVEETGSRLIRDYLRHVIDIINIKNIYRNQYLKQDLSKDYFLHDNGSLAVDFLVEFVGENMDIFRKKLGQTEYADLAGRGAHDLYSNGIFSTFEREEDLFFLDFFNPLKYTVSNMEKIFHFFLRKKMELRYLNIIFAGVLYSIDVEKVKSRIGI